MTIMALARILKVWLGWELKACEYMLEYAM